MHTCTKASKTENIATIIHTFLEALVVSDHIRMSQLFPHNLHLIQQPAEVSALFDGRAPETSMATSYLLQCQELFPLSDLVNLVDAAESSRAQELKDGVATDCGESVSILIGPFNVSLKNSPLTLL